MKRIAKSSRPYGAFCKFCKQPIKEDECYLDNFDGRYWHNDCLPSNLLEETINKEYLSIVIITTTYPVRCNNNATCTKKTIETGVKAAYEKAYARYYHLECVPYEFRKFVEGLK